MHLQKQWSTAWWWWWCCRRWRQRRWDGEWASFPRETRNVAQHSYHKSQIITHQFWIFDTHPGCIRQPHTSNRIDFVPIASQKSICAKWRRKYLSKMIRPKKWYFPVIWRIISLDALANTNAYAIEIQISDVCHRRLIWSYCRLAKKNTIVNSSEGVILSVSGWKPALNEKTRQVYATKTSILKLFYSWFWFIVIFKLNESTDERTKERKNEQTNEWQNWNLRKYNETTASI